MKTNYNLSPLVEAAEHYLSASANYYRLFAVPVSEEQMEYHYREIDLRRTMLQCNLRALITACDIVDVDPRQLLALVRSMQRHYRRLGNRYRNTWHRLTWGGSPYSTTIKRYLAQ